jgi:murein DD-endopeptidase MepM/ murein hydrolase activator NlpD
LRRSAILADKRAMTRATLLLAALAAACASAQPAPISYRSGQQQQPQAPPEAAEAVSGAVESAPRPAHNEPDWADGEGTPLSAYALRPEEAQPYDPARLPRTHRVRGEESLYDIAETYQVPLRALIDQNGLAPPYALEPGRELQLPPPRFHSVARGESFEDVARRYNVDLRSLALLNRMAPPYRVRAGDRIVLPATARAHAPPADVGEAPTVDGASARFQLPLRGPILARFGAQPGGVRVDGLEIAGREGDEIAAAADGDVVYAGSDLPAYGTLVLVRHADDYVTAYGFARRALVREGQRVRAGQPIAELGSRPDGRPRLLFQVRRGAAAVDPAPLLGIGE